MVGLCVNTSKERGWKDNGTWKNRKGRRVSVSSVWLKNPTQIGWSLLIPEKDTHFEVCPFSRSSVRQRASRATDRIHQRKHLALHGNGVVSKDPANSATEQLMDMEPTSCTKHYSLDFKGWTAFRKAFTLRSANSVVAIWCFLFFFFFQGKIEWTDH